MRYLYAAISAAALLALLGRFRADLGQVGVLAMLGLAVAVPWLIIRNGKS
jgi:hypothetical protein